MALKVGARVKFRPTHAKELELTGTVGRIHEGGKVVDVESEAGNGSVSRIYSAHADDCSVIEESEAEAQAPADDATAPVSDAADAAPADDATAPVSDAADAAPADDATAPVSDAADAAPADDAQVLSGTE